MKTRVAAAAIALAVVVGSSILCLQHKDTAVTNATTDIRTWAFGRHLIDLPSNWRYSTGSYVRVNAALSDREAGKIWDAILASIRLRYRAVAPKPPSAFDQVGNPEKAAADKKELDDFLSTDENGMPWTPPESGI